MNTQPVIAIGVININTGINAHGWNIYENGDMEACLTDGGFLILGAPGTMKPGDSYDLISDQSRRSLSKRGKIVDVHSCTDKDKFIQWLKSHNYDYTPIKAFRKRSDSNRKLSTSYVFK
jgi:hypothetical protein